MRTILLLQWSLTYRSPPHHLLILSSTDHQLTWPLIVYLGSLKRREFLTLKSRSHKTAHSPLYTWFPALCMQTRPRLGWRVETRSRFLIVCRVIPTIMLFFPGLLTIPTCHIIIRRYTSSHWSSGCQTGLWLVRVRLLMSSCHLARSQGLHPQSMTSPSVTHHIREQNLSEFFGSALNFDDHYYLSQ